VNKKISALIVATLILTGLPPAQAQQPKKVARVGSIWDSASSSAVAIKSFRERLLELGFIEGQNIVIEYRYWDGKVERLPDLVAELVRLKCDVIFTAGGEAAKAAQNATKEIPIVIASTNDAVKSGFVASLARPGRNITGLTNMGPELSGKRLELLKETVPKLSRVAYLWSPTSSTAEDDLKETETVARSLRVGIQFLEVKKPDDFYGAFQAATQKRAEALMVTGGGFFNFHHKQIIDLAAKNRLPAMYGNPRYVEAGGLMSYTNDRLDQYRRAADYVDKILKGAKPADLPVERPTKFELVINLKTAKQIGLTIPPNVLARADRVVK
jgi:putative ABC transport system substrate-binding protein